MFCVVYHHPGNNLYWDKVPWHGWRSREGIGPKNNKGKNIQNRPSWHIFERASVAYPVGPLLYHYIELLNFPHMLVIETDAYISLYVG